jgi:hypothetical protein
MFAWEKKRHSGISISWQSMNYCALCPSPVMQPHCQPEWLISKSHLRVSFLGLLLIPTAFDRDSCKQALGQVVELGKLTGGAFRKFTFTE